MADTPVDTAEDRALDALATPSAPESTSSIVWRCPSVSSRFR